MFQSRISYEISSISNLILLCLFAISPMRLSAQKLTVDARPRPPELVVNEASGDVSGPLREVLDTAMERYNANAKTSYQLYWRIAPFVRTMTELESGSVDLAPRVIKTSEREAFLFFVGPITTERKDIGFVVPQNPKKLIRSYEDLAGLLIGYKRGAVYFERFDADTTLKKVQCNDDYDFARYFTLGGLDAVIVRDRDALEIAFKANHVTGYSYAPYTVKDTIGIYYGFSKKSKAAAVFPGLNAIVADMVSKGEVVKIYRKFGISLE
jgi:polar amino acid transport system substrate-binding protein